MNRARRTHCDTVQLRLLLLLLRRLRLLLLLLLRLRLLLLTNKCSIHTAEPCMV